MSRRDIGASISERTFATLLLLFPRAFRDRFGRDMRELFRDQLRDARARRATPSLWAQMIPSLLRAALVERAESVRTAVRTRHTPRRNHQTLTTRKDSVLQTIGSDLRFAGRMLRRSPVFTVVAVLII